MNEFNRAEFPMFSVISLCLPYSTAVFDISDGASVTWYEPLPVETISDHNVDHSKSTQLREGSINASLSWNFSLSEDLSLISLNLKFNNGFIGGVSPQGQAGIAGAYIERFQFIWIPSKRATLIIYNVTMVDNGTFSCDVTVYDSVDFSSKTWTSKIQVNVVGKPSKFTILSLLI